MAIFHAGFRFKYFWVALVIVIELQFLVLLLVAVASAEVITPQVRRQNDLQMSVLPGGGLVVSAYGRQFAIDSLFSQPGLGHGRGSWNVFVAAPARSVGWSVVARRLSSTSVRVVGTCRLYRIDRLYSLVADHVVVSDNVTLLTDATVGILVRHTLMLDHHQVQSVRLGGRDVGEGRGACGTINQGNPSLFVAADSLGIGMIPLDDVFKVQGILGNAAIRGPARCSVSNPPSVELDDRNFGLDHSRTYTMRWAVYVVSAGRSDPYYWFINRVRQDIGANFTVYGGSLILEPIPVSLNRAGFAGDWRTWTSAQLSRLLKDSGVKYVILGIPWKQNGRLAHGSAVFHEISNASRQFINDTIQTVHAARPEVKVLQYVDPFASTETGAELKYKGARIVDRNGTPLAWPYGYPIPYFCPTTSNSFGHDLYKYADLVMDTFHADGLYIDDSCCSIARYDYSGVWDGLSVEIEPTTFQVRRKIAAVPLVSLQARVGLVRRIRERGGLVVANTAPLTETFALQKVIAFTETGALASTYSVQLHSPIALNKGPGQERDSDPGIKIGTDVAKNVVAHINLGALTYYYRMPYPKAVTPNPMSEMFPFTPLEIWSGYLLGVERIITAKSGSFGWNTREPLEVFVYARDGRLRAHNNIPVGTGSTFVSVELSAGELGIIVRQSS